jgi:opacity protein-like surface antigen
MKEVITIVALLLMGPAWLPAQERDNQPQGQGYVFVGGANHEMNLVAGLGGEAYCCKGLGGGVELGAAGRGGNTKYLIGVVSPDLSYHFFPKKIHMYPSPFVEGGYSLFFGHDVWIQPPGVFTGHYTSGFNVGVGLDYFATKHIGMRLEARYYGHGGRILWAAFPNLAQLSFTAFRIAFTFRLRPGL